MPANNELHLFCEYIIEKYESPDRVTEEQKANEFRRRFFKTRRLTVKNLANLARSFDIRLDSLEEDRMPCNLRGYHETVDGRRYVYFKKDDTISGIMNTILHEIREIMEVVFLEKCPTSTCEDRHIAANRFASAVLLPKKGFTQQVYETGFDVVELSRIYAKSCSQVLLRLGEVLQGKLFLYVALYEPDFENGKENGWKVNYWTGSANTVDPDANIGQCNGLFPKKGQVMLPGSLIDFAVNSGKPFLAEHIQLIDDIDDEGLIAIANPLIIEGYPAKVVLLALMKRYRCLLIPQIERLHPRIIEKFYRHL